VEQAKPENLEKWVNQEGVILNSCITAQTKNPLSHQKRAWKTITSFNIDYLNKHSKGLTFLLRYKPLQRKEEPVNGHRHFILRSTHLPVFLVRNQTFFGNKSFTSCQKQSLID